MSYRIRYFLTVLWFSVGINSIRVAEVIVLLLIVKLPYKSATNERQPDQLY